MLWICISARLLDKVHKLFLDLLCKQKQKILLYTDGSIAWLITLELLKKKRKKQILLAPFSKGIRWG